MTALSRKLRSCRRFRGLTQAQVAGRAGLTASTICRLERGKYSPSLRNLIRIAEAMQWPMEFLDELLESFAVQGRDPEVTPEKGKV